MTLNPFKKGRNPKFTSSEASELSELSELPEKNHGEGSEAETLSGADGAQGARELPASLETDSDKLDGARAISRSKQVDFKDSEHPIGIVGFPDSGKTAYFFSVLSVGSVDPDGWKLRLGGSNAQQYLHQLRERNFWTNTSVDMAFEHFHALAAVRKTFGRTWRFRLPVLRRLGSAQYDVYATDGPGELAELAAKGQTELADKGEKTKQSKYLNELARCEGLLCLLDPQKELRPDSSARVDRVQDLVNILTKVVEKRKARRKGIGGGIERLAVTFALTKADQLWLDPTLNSITLALKQSRRYKFLLQHKPEKIERELDVDENGGMVTYPVEDMVELREHEAVEAQCIAWDFLNCHFPEVGKAIWSLDANPEMEIDLFLMSSWGVELSMCGEEGPNKGKPFVPRAGEIKPSGTVFPLGAILDRIFIPTNERRWRRFSLKAAAILLIVLMTLGPWFVPIAGWFAGKTFGAEHLWATESIMWVAEHNPGYGWLEARDPGRLANLTEYRGKVAAARMHEASLTENLEDQDAASEAFRIAIERAKALEWQDSEHREGIENYRKGLELEFANNMMSQLHTELERKDADSALTALLDVVRVMEFAPEMLRRADETLRLFCSDLSDAVDSQRDLSEEGEDTPEGWRKIEEGISQMRGYIQEFESASMFEKRGALSLADRADLVKKASALRAMIGGTDALLRHGQGAPDYSRAEVDLGKALREAYASGDVAAVRWVRGAEAEIFDYKLENTYLRNLAVDNSMSRPDEVGDVLRGAIAVTDRVPELQPKFAAALIKFERAVGMRFRSVFDGADVGVLRRTDLENLLTCIKSAEQLSGGHPKADGLDALLKLDDLKIRLTGLDESPGNLPDLLDVRAALSAPVPEELEFLSSWDVVESIASARRDAQTEAVRSCVGAIKKACDGDSRWSVARLKSLATRLRPIALDCEDSLPHLTRVLACLDCLVTFEEYSGGAAVSQQHRGVMEKLYGFLVEPEIAELLEAIGARLASKPETWRSAVSFRQLLPEDTLPEVARKINLTYRDGLVSPTGTGIAEDQRALEGYADLLACGPYFTEDLWWLHRKSREPNARPALVGARPHIYALLTEHTDQESRDVFFADKQREVLLDLERRGIADFTYPVLDVEHAVSLGVTEFPRKMRSLRAFKGVMDGLVGQFAFVPRDGEGDAFYIAKKEFSVADFVKNCRGEDLGFSFTHPSEPGHFSVSPTGLPSPAYRKFVRDQEANKGYILSGILGMNYEKAEKMAELGVSNVEGSNLLVARLPRASEWTRALSRSFDLDLSSMKTSLREWVSSPAGVLGRSFKGSGRGSFREPSDVDPVSLDHVQEGDGEPEGSGQLQDVGFRIVIQALPNDF